jgi:predicted membrane chloride channel (bestrophin family)
VVAGDAARIVSRTMDMMKRWEKKGRREERKRRRSFAVFTSSVEAVTAVVASCSSIFNVPCGDRHGGGRG